MNVVIMLPLIISYVGGRSKRYLENDDLTIIDMFDLTRPTLWKDLAEYYSVIEKGWKICVNCGIPALGTGIHLEHATRPGSMQPALIPAEYLLTRLEIIDVSYLTKLHPSMVLSLDTALQWPVLKHDPREPTLALFKFGWIPPNDLKRQCVCKIPGISYDLAEYIATNLSHIVGVATDAPTLESDETRELTERTVANILGKNGIYMIENVNLKKRLPQRACMTIAMPLMLSEASYVPTRLTAFCPTQNTNNYVTLALKKSSLISHTVKDKYHVNLKDLMN